MESSFQWNSKTKVDFLKKLPTEAHLTDALGFKPEKILVIFDRRLKKSELIAKWLKNFPDAYAVTAGEGLKDLSTFSAHLKKIFKLISPFSARSVCVVGVGGGSVGDFSGFLSSVLKRGVPLVHIPTTLLAAMDSAHGGKTALNVGAFKNQVGTFYSADVIFIVKSLFEGLPRLQLQSASGELAKMALLEGGRLFERFKNEFEPELESIWQMLPAVIEAKYKVVEKDPFEQTGERQILNLGHSLGHALESYFGLAHGVAVGEGLLFAIAWSEHQGYYRGTDAKEILKLLRDKAGFLEPREFSQTNRAMSRSRLRKLIVEDKKLTDTRHLSFIFLEKPGAPFRKVVSVDSLLTESQRQGWTAV